MGRGSRYRCNIVFAGLAKYSALQPAFKNPSANMFLLAKQLILKENNNQYSGENCRIRDLSKRSNQRPSAPVCSTDKLAHSGS
jgi:hypothetical protein